MNLLGFDTKGGFSEGFSGGYGSNERLTPEQGLTVGRELRDKMEQKRKKEARNFRMTVTVMLAGLGVLGLITWFLIR